ncbi:MAG: HDIG domain-containing protein, partial [Myxococcales bacterium]|nr:HDIG domain-containing protein [Myxococcales bacterium]
MNLPANQPHDVRVLERLQADGTISASQREQVLNHARRVDDMTCVDAIVDLGVLDEQTILQYLATLYRTRFVSTKKLAAAVVDARTLAQVPQRIAEQIAVCPILFDVRNGSLSVVCDNFEGEDIGKQVQMASGVREVKTYLARRAAIRALIRKHYLNESSAFVELQLRTNQPVGTDIDPAQPFYSGAGATVGHPSLDNYMSHPPRFSSPPELQPVPRRVDSLIPQRERVISSFTIEAPEIVSNLRGEVDEVQRDVAAHEDDSVPNQRYLETLNVLTALLENSREGMRGHSAQVARLCKKICERVGLKDAQMHGILVAAYLHDIGKASNYHLTAFNVAQYEGHRTKAEKTHMTPLRIFEAADLPESAIKTLTHMYEAFNG